MFKADVNLVIKQGSDFTFSMSFLGDDDEPLDLTLYPNSSFIAKLCSPDGDIVISANTTNGQLLLSPTELTVFVPYDELDFQGNKLVADMKLSDGVSTIIPFSANIFVYQEV